MKDMLIKLSYLFSVKERWQLAGIFILILLSAVVETLSIGLVLPFIYSITQSAGVQQHYLLGTFYDLTGSRTPEEFVLWICIGLIVLFVLKNTFLVVLKYIQSRFVAMKQASLSHRLFHAYIYSPYIFHLQRNSAELLRNINGDVGRVCNGVVMSLLILVTDTTIALFIIIMISLVDPLSFLVIAGMLGGSMLVFHFSLKNMLNRLGKKRQIFSKQKIQTVNQGLGGIKEAQVLGREGFFVNAFHEPNLGTAHILHVEKFIKAIPRPFSETLIVTCGMLILIVAILTEQGLHSALPTLTLFAAAGYRLIPTFSQFASSVTTIRTALPSLDAVYEDLRALEQPEPARYLPPEVPFQASDTLLAIQLKDVYYSYPNTSQYVLKGISLTISRAQSIGLVGSSGAGKTTLVDVILGLLPPTQGSMLGFGENIHHNLRAWQRNIGYIPQTIYLCDDTIRANVAFGIPDNEIDDTLVWQALQIAQLKSFIESLSQSLDTIIGERGVRLSGGQRQRIGIARALYHNPEILIMDEATAALDNETEKAFVQAIQKLSGTKTIIIIAHRLSTVRNCDQLCFIKDGQIVDIGTYDELIYENAEFRSMATPVAHV